MFQVTRAGRACQLSKLSNIFIFFSFSIKFYMIAEVDIETLFIHFATFAINEFAYIVPTHELNIVQGD